MINRNNAIIIIYQRIYFYKFLVKYMLVKTVICTKSSAILILKEICYMLDFLDKLELFTNYYFLQIFH